MTAGSNEEAEPLLKAKYKNQSANWLASLTDISFTPFTLQAKSGKSLFDDTFFQPRLLACSAMLLTSRAFSQRWLCSALKGVQAFPLHWNWQTVFSPPRHILPHTHTRSLRNTPVYQGCQTPNEEISYCCFKMIIFWPQLLYVLRQLEKNQTLGRCS